MCCVFSGERVCSLRRKTNTFDLFNVWEPSVHLIRLNFPSLEIPTLAPTVINSNCLFFHTGVTLVLRSTRHCLITQQLVVLGALIPSVLVIYLFIVHLGKCQPNRASQIFSHFKSADVKSQACTALHCEMSNIRKSQIFSPFKSGDVKSPGKDLPFSASTLSNYWNSQILSNYWNSQRQRRNLILD